MHFSASLAAVGAMLGMAAANFHIVAEVFSTDVSYTLPSNKFYCTQLGDYGQVTTGSVGDSYFQVTGNTCGVGTMDFYKQSDGSYKFYKHNGDGSLQGQCYSNYSGDLDCPAPLTAFDEYVCYSYICED